MLCVVVKNTFPVSSSFRCVLSIRSTVFTYTHCNWREKITFLWPWNRQIKSMSKFSQEHLQLQRLSSSTLSNELDPCFKSSCQFCGIDTALATQGAFFINAFKFPFYLRSNTNISSLFIFLPFLRCWKVYSCLKYLWREILFNSRNEAA